MYSHRASARSRHRVTLNQVVVWRLSSALADGLVDRHAELQHRDPLRRVLEFRIAPDIADNREVLVGHGLFAP